MAALRRDLEERSKSFLELVGARFGLDHRPAALLENIKSIETVLSNQVSVSIYELHFCTDMSDGRFSDGVVVLWCMLFRS